MITHTLCFEPGNYPGTRWTDIENAGTAFPPEYIPVSVECWFNRLLGILCSVSGTRVYAESWWHVIQTVKYRTRSIILWIQSSFSDIAWILLCRYVLRWETVRYSYRVTIHSEFVELRLAVTHTHSQASVWGELCENPTCSYESQLTGTPMCQSNTSMHFRNILIALAST